MSMTNIFYRFLHLTSNEKYGTMRAGLRMNVMRTHGIDPLDFELWSTAVSAINGCGACVDSHEKVMREKGVSEEKILAAVRIASVVHAIAVVLDAEQVGPRLLVEACLLYTSIKVRLPEGDGLQAVRKRRKINSALAAAGLAVT